MAVSKSESIFDDHAYPAQHGASEVSEGGGEGGEGRKGEGLLTANYVLYENYTVFEIWCMAKNRCIMPQEYTT
jgi:hypothetical protein